jgi:SNF2 family DNA or RNA helicase
MLEKQRGVIAVHSVGTGKTLTAVTASQCFLQKHPIAKVIVVTPVSLIDNFKKEMLSYGISNKDPHYVFYSHSKFILDFQNGKIKPQDLRGNMIIIDEIHNFKKTPILTKLGPGKLATLTPNQRKHLINGVYYPTRGYYIREAASYCEKVLGLTATPIVNSIEDLRILISVVTKSRFANRMKNSNNIGEKIGALGSYTSEAAIMARSHGIFSFYERAKEDPRFPRFDIKNVYIKMPKDYLASYEKIEQGMKMNNVNYKTDATAFFGNIRKAVNKIDNTLNSPKVLWTINKIQKTVRAGGKVLLYSVWLDSGIKMIAKKLQALNIPYNFISGELSQNKRQEIVREYNSGKTPVLLISKAGGEGLDLKETTVAIMLEPVWNPATEMQVFGRAVRNGSHSKLPVSKRYVKCYLLFLIKPPESIASNTNKLAVGSYAADQIIYAYTQRKRAMIRHVYQGIAKFSPWKENRRTKVK